MYNPFRRATPEEKERARIEALLKNCRNIEGMLTDTAEPLVYFTYEVRGVTYHAAQDVSAIVGADLVQFGNSLGPVTVRYSTSNPANSIIFAKDWNGLKKNEIKGTSKHA